MFWISKIGVWCCSKIPNTGLMPKNQEASKQNRQCTVSIVFVLKVSASFTFKDERKKSDI